MSASEKISVELPGAVFVALRLVEVATDLPRDEIVARAISRYAAEQGLPALARDMDEFEKDLEARL